MLSQFAGFKYNSDNPEDAKRRREERVRNTLVPCHWPDKSTSAPPVADANHEPPADDAKDHVEPSSQPAEQVEYGLLYIHLGKLSTPRLSGEWKLRTVLEHGSSFTDTEFDMRRGPIFTSGSGSVSQILRLALPMTAQPLEAVLHLFFERHMNSDQPPGDDTETLTDLGYISLGPFEEPCKVTMNSSPSKNAEVKIDMYVTYSRGHLPADMETGSWEFNWAREKRHDLGGLELVKEKHTDTSCLMANVCADDYRAGSATFSLDSPWILPVRFTYRSPGRLYLLTPMSSSKHLLGHVQKCRRVTEQKAQLYAAQVVCALDSLHDLGVVALLGSENVLLDVYGNVRIVSPRLFTTDQSFDIDQSTYPAPEVLSGDGPSRLTDWWMLGCHLYEMVTGLPPFYHQDQAERDRKTLTEELDVPAYLQGATADILRRLLDKNPTQRLGGASGASEIKKHDFFLGVDWQNPSAGCLELSLFQPHDVKNIYKNSPRRITPKTPASHSEPGGIQNKEDGPADDSRSEWIIERPRSPSDVFNPALSEEVELGPDQIAVNTLQADSERQGTEPEAIMARLKAALQMVQITEDNVAHVLDASASDDVLATVLKSAILLVNTTPVDTDSSTELKCEVPITALEWAVELGREDLVHLFLDRGADANRTFDERYGPALTRAARERRTRLVDILAPKTSRVNALRTLCMAVEQRDMPTVTCLLSRGVPCDFDTADHPMPPPRSSHYHFSWCGNEGTPWDPSWSFVLPPIVRAARHGDAAMVRVLLSHGADPNTAYHSMKSLLPGWHDVQRFWGGSRNHGFVCGRVVQLAMQLGHRDVVDALLEGGADIGLPHSEWHNHKHFCHLVPRSVYLQVTAGLEEAARSRGGWLERSEGVVRV